MTSKNFFAQVVVVLIYLLHISAVHATSYTKPSDEVGLKLKGYDPKVNPGYPHEYGFGHYYQGDIILRPTLKPTKGGRLVLTDKYVVEKWEDGIVPYVIKGNFTKRELDMLQAAFDQIGKMSCVRFVPRTEKDLYFVTITNADQGCYSYVGRSATNDYNRINLQTPECFTDIGTVVHQMLHTLGFFHECVREDRDEYIILNATNLEPEYQTPEFIQANYAKVSPGQATTYGAKYNYGSVMHYSRFAASIGYCCPTIVNLKPYFGDFGSPSGLTELDAKQINAKYCSDRIQETGSY